MADPTRLAEIRHILVETPLDTSLPDAFAQADYVIFDDDGFILEGGRVYASKVAACAGPHVLAGPGRPDTHYVDLSGPTILLRGPSTALVSGTDITDLPNPTWLTVDGTTHVVTDGVAELSFADPGTYEVRLRTPSQADAILKVIAP